MGQEDVGGVVLGFRLASDSEVGPSPTERWRAPRELGRVFALLRAEMKTAYQERDDFAFEAAQRAASVVFADAMGRLEAALRLNAYRGRTTCFPVHARH